MTITRSRVFASVLDGFIEAAPDGKEEGVRSSGLKAKRGNQRSQVSVVLPDIILSRLDIVAEQRFMSRSALITMVISQFLEGANES